MAYRKKGGCLAITDANLVLGRVLPDFFPKIFGEHEDLPLDSHGARWGPHPSSHISSPSNFTHFLVACQCVSLHLHWVGLVFSPPCRRRWA